MPEHRLQKTRDAYFDPAVALRDRVFARAVDDYTTIYNRAMNDYLRLHAESQRLQDLRMEHDESRTP